MTVAGLLRLSLTVCCIAQLQPASQHPDSLRDAITHAFSLAASASSTQEQSRQIEAARRLANKYSATWSDSFFIRQVDRFSRALPVARRLSVLADSLRRAGNLAMQSEGIPKAMSLWRESMRAAQRAGDQWAMIPIRVSIGGGFYRLGDLDSATLYLKRAETDGTRIGDRRSVANAIGILASVAKDRGNLESALVFYQRAIRLREISGDTRGMAADANNIGAIAQQRGDLDAATRQYERALSLNRKDGRSTLVALNLDNLAEIATIRGDYARAELFYKEALSLNQKSGARADAAFLLHGLGRLYASRGDYSRAARVIEESIRVHDSTGAVTEAVKARADLAEIKSAMGFPEEARRLLMRATSEALSSNAPPSATAPLAMTRADLAVEFGSFADAAADYDRAALLYESAQDSPGVASAIEGKAVVLHARGDYASAMALMRNAATLRRASGNVRSSSMTKLSLAEMQIAQEDFTSAGNTALASRDGFRSVGDVAGEAAAMVILGDVARRAGNFKTAISAYESGLARLGSRRASDIQWRLHTGLAQTLKRTGNLNRAAFEFRNAIELSESAASGVRLEERRAGFNAEKWVAYRELALVELARGRTGEAFALSEKLRARQMVDLMSRGRVALSRDPSREQDMRRKIGMLTRELSAHETSFAQVREPRLDPRPVAAVRRELDKAQKEYAAELLRLREANPSYARLISASTRSWKEIASRLGRDQVLIEYLLTDSASIAFVVTSNAVAALDLKTDPEKIVNLVEFARKTIDKPAGLHGRLYSAPLRRLYSTLITPLESQGYLRGKKTLVIAPHSELHFLSFAALIDPSTNRFLIDRFDVLYTPSATVWAQLHDRPPHSIPPRILAFAPNVQRLPATREEVDAIGRIYGQRAVIRTGKSATLGALQAELRTAGTIHLATFGVLNKHNPLFSFIELAPGATEDGHLDVNEVFGLPLSGQLVVLSACQTAMGSGALADVPAGDDWVSLVQAFLQAGANTVVASLWPVEDRATAVLMSRFHLERSRGFASASAIARAQRFAIRNPKTADPFYWAAFTASGRGE